MNFSNSSNRKISFQSNFSDEIGEAKLQRIEEASLLIYAVVVGKSYSLWFLRFYGFARMKRESKDNGERVELRGTP